MAGHSKWANIKHRKGVNDTKRAKLYTKLIKEVYIAVKEGGEDPNKNTRLRAAIQNAKGANVPKDTIQKAINKAFKNDGENYSTIIYEGYAPNGVAVIVECMTDNINRTVSSIRSIFNKYKGNLGKSGSITHLFEKKGMFRLDENIVTDEDSLTLELIDAGASEIEKEEDYFYILCPINAFGNIQKKLELLGLEPISSEVCYLPTSRTSLNKNEAEQVEKLLDVLDDDDDVQKIYHNMTVKDVEI